MAKESHFRQSVESVLIRYHTKYRQFGYIEYVFLFSFEIGTYRYREHAAKVKYINIDRVVVTLALLFYTFTLRVVSIHD